jgi:adenosylcobyric acid synthase
VSALLVAGTTSDAGKSIVTTGLCRAFARRGVKVAPFKAQNMSNNSMVCAGTDGGAEIGRAQWIQALAARVAPEPAMNPVLLKPGSDNRSHVVVMGRPAGAVSSRDFVDGRRHLARAATTPSTISPHASTWSSPKGQAARRRSTCGPATT